MKTRNLLVLSSLFAIALAGCDFSKTSETPSTPEQSTVDNSSPVVSPSEKESNTTDEKSTVEDSSIATSSNDNSLDDTSKDLSNEDGNNSELSVNDDISDNSNPIYSEDESGSEVSTPEESSSEEEDPDAEYLASWDEVNDYLSEMFNFTLDEPVGASKYYLYPEDDWFYTEIYAMDVTKLQYDAFLDLLTLDDNFEYAGIVEADDGTEFEEFLFGDYYVDFYYEDDEEYGPYLYVTISYDEPVEPVDENVLTLNSTNLGLGAYPNPTASATVSGITFEWTAVGEYGNGMQFKKNTGALYNTTAIEGGVTGVYFKLSESKALFGDTSFTIYCSNSSDFNDSITKSIDFDKDDLTYYFTFDESYEYVKFANTADNAKYFSEIGLYLNESSIEPTDPDDEYADKLVKWDEVDTFLSDYYDISLPEPVGYTKAYLFPDDDPYSFAEVYFVGMSEQQYNAYLSTVKELDGFDYQGVVKYYGEDYEEFLVDDSMLVDLQYYNDEDWGYCLYISVEAWTGEDDSVVEMAWSELNDYLEENYEFTLPQLDHDGTCYFYPETSLYDTSIYVDNFTEKLYESYLEILKSAEGFEYIGETHFEGNDTYDEFSYNDLSFYFQFFEDDDFGSCLYITFFGASSSTDDYDTAAITNKDASLPEGENGIFDIDFTKSEYKDLTDLADMGYVPTGHTSVLVIPVTFPDTEITMSINDIKNCVYPTSKTNAELNYRSLYDYFYTSSFGKLDLDIIVVDEYYVTEHDSSYYRNWSDDRYQYVDGTAIVMHEACTYLDQHGYDFTKYDSNNDRYVDYILLVNTTTVDHSENGADFDWAFCYSNYYTTEPEGDDLYEFDGVSANIYVWLPSGFFFESDITGGQTTDKPINTYTLVHESSHAIGADDYYDTAYVKHPLNGYDVMDAAKADHSPYTKLIYGWIDQAKLVTTDSSVSITLESFETTGDMVLFGNHYDETLGAFQEYYIAVYYTNEGNNAGEAFGLVKEPSVVFYHIDASLTYYEEYEEYQVYNNNTNIKDPNFGTVHNLIEILFNDEGKPGHVAGDSISGLVNNLGEDVIYSVTVDSINENGATLTFTRN